MRENLYSRYFIENEPHKFISTFDFEFPSSEREIESKNEDLDKYLDEFSVEQKGT